MKLRRGFCIVLVLLSLGKSVGQEVTPTNAAAGEWLQFGGEPTGTRFSSLDQVNVQNVASLRVAWAVDLGFTGRVQGSPAAWSDMLFVSTEAGLLALDATSGDHLWHYTEASGARTQTGLPIQAPRGSPVVLPTQEGEAAVVAAMPNAPVVVALDARTGEPIWRTDVGNPDFSESLRTNPLLAGDVLVVGPTGADFSPVPGRVVALQVEDGKVLWTFDLVPVNESDPARPSWSPYPPGRMYGVGGGSAWNAGAFDPQSGLIVYGTGQPFPSDRLDPRRFDSDGAISPDLYTASFVALDARTGELAWFHQIVPADEWGYDQHTVPIITDLNLGAGSQRVVILATTTGFVLVVDIEGGDLLASHRMVELSTVHVGYDEDGRPVLDEQMRRSSPEEIQRVCPGPRWASIAPGAFDSRTGLLYRPNDVACVRQGVSGPPDEWQPGVRPTWLLADVRQPEDYFDRWGALTALDPASGQTAWSFETPYPHDAGVLVTAGGLVFSAFADRVFRAFDSETGEVLWTQILASHSDAAPITYSVGGVQYVAVMAGRDTEVNSLPQSGLPDSVTGPATLYVFALDELL